MSDEAAPPSPQATLDATLLIPGPGRFDRIRGTITTRSTREVHLTTMDPIRFDPGCPVVTAVTLSGELVFLLMQVREIRDGTVRDPDVVVLDWVVTEGQLKSRTEFLRDH